MVCVYNATRKAALISLLMWSALSSAAELYRYQNEAGITVVDWTIPAAFVANGYEVLSESGQVLRVVPRMQTETEREQAAAAEQQVKAEAAAVAAQIERDTFLLRRYSTVEDIEAARDRSLRELDIRISILSGQRQTLYQQLEKHESVLGSERPVGEPAALYQQDTINALRAEISSLDDAIRGRRAQSAAVAEAFGRDIARFAELEEIVALRREMSQQSTKP